MSGATAITAALSKSARQALGGGLFTCFVLTLCFIFGLPQLALGQDSDEAIINRESPLKALFIYNFGGYIEWPSSAFADEQAPFVIGVLGHTQVDDSLRQIAITKKIGGRKIVVTDFAAVRDIKPCQILFIAREVPQKEQRAAIDSLKDRPTLIVGESDGFATAGGGINFFLQANKIRFEVNVAATKRLQLKVSSKLLAMAKIIEDGPVQR